MVTWPPLSTAASSLVPSCSDLASTGGSNCRTSRAGSSWVSSGGRGGRRPRPRPASAAPTAHCRACAHCKAAAAASLTHVSGSAACAHSSASRAKRSHGCGAGNSSNLGSGRLPCTAIHPMLGGTGHADDAAYINRGLASDDSAPPGVKKSTHWPASLTRSCALPSASVTRCCTVRKVMRYSSPSCQRMYLGAPTQARCSEEVSRGHQRRAAHAHALAMRYALRVGARA